jgi:hypothetical protein
MKQLEKNDQEVLNLLRPETSLELHIATHPDFLKGMWWGSPRFGHPEGEVVYHIKDVLNNIQNLDSLDPQERRILRLVAYVHDSFKYIEEEQSPRIHHGKLGRRFLENIVTDVTTLDLVEFHDEAYYAWRHFFVDRKVELAQKRLGFLKEKFSDKMNLFSTFFKCDTNTGDKIMAPVKWFEIQMQ